MTPPILRPATQDDLDFLVKIDLKDEGCTSPLHYAPEELINHREKIAAFVTQVDDAAWVLDDAASGARVGAIMCRFRDRTRELTYDSLSIVGDEWLLPNTRYCEIFQLWVDPAFRRQGLATILKRHIETEARSQGINFIYTHTEEHNLHVIDLNRKLGYREVRRGPIWDDVIRVSLVKRLD